MHWLKPLFYAGESLIDRVLCVLGAVIASQAPEFMQQYLQRLGGHLAEARRQLAQFEEIARSVGRSLSELAVQYSVNSDPSVVGVGRLMTGTESRVATLAQAETALRDAAVWERPFVFLRHMDTGIARATADVFKPAVPTTIEGALYALAGVVLLLGIYRGMIRPLVVRLFTKRVPSTPDASRA